MARTSALLRDGTILNDRYRIIRQIGRGGFGRTYLAEDTQRYREKCVLKEFAPQVESDRSLRKAEELFAREAGILYKLKHDQIPRFEALLKTRVDGKDCLFLVQEYIDGDSYWDLLKRGGKFSEEEITKLLAELLPVLSYIHQENLIHRDISPDNLIKRHSDGKPVLIDFGCVKIAANAVSQSTGQYITLIGKKGYAPEEQMGRGKAIPSSDLYSLAATIVVLLTGKQPDDIYNSHKGSWHWRSHAKVSSELAKILDKMLSYHPRDRYPSAEKVSQVLTAQSNSFASNLISRLRTLVVAPGDSHANSNSKEIVKPVVAQANSNISRLNTQPFSAQISKFVSNGSDRPKLKRFGLILLGVIFVPGILSFTFINNLFNLSNSFSFKSKDNTYLLQKEQNKQKEIYQRIEALNLNPSTFYNQVDRLFYQKYPNLKGVQLTEDLKHRQYREKWYEIANQLLDKRE
ncbi:MAG: serine/threonine-protein kinase [Xenococcaceae cyanobacterium MO_188.B29]|nr:serine/threonine-protein kinase [Xenococcaceae cyanobacterium MO_188.B29]